MKQDERAEVAHFGYWKRGKDASDIDGARPNYRLCMDGKGQDGGGRSDAMSAYCTQPTIRIATAGC